MRITLMLFVAILATLMGCAPSLKQDCSSDNDCKGETCVAGVCIGMNDANDLDMVSGDSSHPDRSDSVQDSRPSDMAVHQDGLPPDSMSHDMAQSNDVPVLDQGPSDGKVADARVSDARVEVDGPMEPKDALVLADSLPADVPIPDMSLPPDMGPTCVPPEGTNLGDGCEAGVGACQASGHWICNGNVAQCDAVAGNPTQELCNGIDDDCDGEVDEDFPELGNSCGEGVGACEASGVFVCNQADLSTVICSAEVLPASGESCDGVDNNCDGTIDEGYGVGDVCVVGIGACQRQGVQQCTANGQTTVCDVLPGSPGEEQCNDIDDNCDGSVDEGLHLGDDCTVGRGLCESHGRIVCSEDGSTHCDATPGQPTAEVCDGLDNDCDGNIDEANNGAPLSVSCYNGPQGTVGVGACHSGTQTCNNGVFAACVNEVTPTAETCNGIDDDCNGVTDNNVPGAGSACDTGLPGICSTGTTVCNQQHNLMCQPITNVGQVQEVCGNGRDEDCNGVTDDGLLCTCVPATQQNCYDGPAGTAGVGLCHQGRQTCNVGGLNYGPCMNEVLPAQEICDGFDNDCDGNVDEGLGKGDPCSVGVGECRRDGIMVCAPDGTTMCNVQAGNNQPEVCNGLDDDCDGIIDEAADGGPLTQPCYTGRPAQTQNVGTCHGGTQTCTNGSFGSCNGEVTPVVEFCDGRDEDCNNVVDNGFNVGAPCTNGLGICQAPGQMVCSPNGETTQCNAVPGNPAAAEVCNGLDDDCDGSVDEGVLNACGHCGPVPREECNGIDDDCDGRVDNGFGVFIPAGQVRASDGNLYQVDAMCVQTTEVETSAYMNCVNNGPCPRPANNLNCDGFVNMPGNPITCVDHQFADTYCQSIGARLPTRHEWEKAFRGGLTVGGQNNPLPARNFPWGNAEVNCNLANFGLCQPQSINPANSHPDGASPYGILNLAGNAWEWISDGLDPTALGGGWQSSQQTLVIGSRYISPVPDIDIGFRCVFDAVPPH